MTRFVRSLLALSAAVTICGAAAPASADGATAEALFREGKRLFDGSQFDQACPKFAESQREDPQIGTLVALAACYGKAGKTASEWATYNTVAFEAKKRGDSARADAAQKKAAELEPTLSKLTINVTGTPVQGLLLRRDGEEVGAGALSTAIPIDPGTHKLEATAPGYEVWETTVTVGPNGDQKAVTIPPMTPKPEGSSGGDGQQGNPGRRTASYVVGGVAVVGLGLGAVTGLVAMSDKNSATSSNALCGSDKTCSAAGRDKINSASTMATISTVGFGVGIVAVGVASFLFITSRGSAPASDAAPPPPAPAARLVPSAGPTGGGLTLVGSF